MTELMDAVDVIRIKRDGGALSNAQIDWVIDAYTRGAVADEQMAALAMAIFLRGMTRTEISRWTAAMIASGERMDFTHLGATADKHSTGGVGDKILMLADGNGTYAKALGLELDGSKFGMGTRGQRFAIIAKNGVATQVNVEGPGEFKVSAAEFVLKQL